MMDKRLSLWMKHTMYPKKGQMVTLSKMKSTVQVVLFEDERVTHGMLASSLIIKRIK